MAHSESHADGRVRAYLIETRSEVCTMYTDVALDGGPEFGEYVNRELRKGVDPLIAGEAVGLRRYELPDGHPMGPPHGGDPSDWLILDEHDVLHDVDRSSARTDRVQPI